MIHFDLMLVDKYEMRASPKKFKEDFILTEETNSELIRIANLSPTSMGIQLTRLLLVTDPIIKNELMGHSYNQSQVGTCSTLAILCTKESNYESNIEEYLNLLKSTRGTPNETIMNARGSIKRFLESKTEQQTKDWAMNQTYITLGAMISYCAMNSLDCCPMEGFIKEKYMECLGSHLGDYKPTVLLAIGSVSEEDTISKLPKVRIPDSKYNILGGIERTL